MIRKLINAFKYVKDVFYNSILSYSNHVAIILQDINVPNQHIVHLKITKCYMPIIYQ